MTVNPVPAFQFLPDQSLIANAQRIAVRELRGSIKRCRQPRSYANPVHDVRKQCKRLRGLLRLLRDAMPQVYSQENLRLRDVARHISAARDQQALLEAWDALLSHPAAPSRSRCRPLRSALSRAVVSEVAEAAPLLAEVRPELEEALRGVPAWRLQREGFAAMRPGLQRTYLRGQQGFRRVSLSGDAGLRHEWRKRVKYHRYHLALLRGINPEVVPGHWQQARRLAELLGEERDLMLLQDFLIAEPALADRADAVGLTRHLVDTREEVWRRVRGLGAQVYAETPEAHVRRMKAYWDSKRQASWD